MNIINQKFGINEGLGWKELISPTTCQSHWFGCSSGHLHKQKTFIRLPRSSSYRTQSPSSKPNILHNNPTTSANLEIGWLLSGGYTIRRPFLYYKWKLLSWRPLFKQLPFPNSIYSSYLMYKSVPVPPSQAKPLPHLQDNF